MARGTVARMLLGVGAAAVLFVLWSLAGAPGYAPTLPLDEQDPAGGQESEATAGGAAGFTLPGMKTQTALVNGINLFYRDVGTGPETMVLLHGFPETGDTFHRVIPALSARYRLIIPDLRGFGRSDRPAGGYDKATVATDVKLLLDQLGVDKVHMVSHDIGGRVGFDFAVQYPNRLSSLTVAETLLEGLPGLVLFDLFGRYITRAKHFFIFDDADEAAARYRGKEQQLILWFLNSRSHAHRYTAQDVSAYVDSFKRDRGMWAAFKHYEAFTADKVFNQAADVAPLRTLPILALGGGGAEGAGDLLGKQLQAKGLPQVQSVLIPDSGHWLFEEQPERTVQVVQEFIDRAIAARQR